MVNEKLSPVDEGGASSGGGFLGAAKKSPPAAGSIVQQIHRRLSDVVGSVAQMVDIPGSDYEEMAQPHNEEKRLEEELERKFAERFATKFRDEQERSLGVSLTELGRSAIVVEEDNSNLAPRRVFHKLDISTDSHPFFKRQWIVRHRLDGSSPLLSPKARRLIEENGGYWPENLNHSAGIREYLQFRELIVSFSGTANATGSSVYSTKVYDYCDVNIGYTFANVLHRHGTDGKLVVDTTLVHDVQVQRGGGAEPFRSRAVRLSSYQ